MNTLNPTAGKGTGSDDRAAVAEPSDSPWCSLHTGTLLQNLAQLSKMREGQFTLEIYPAGVVMEVYQGYVQTPPVTNDRGEIMGFSHKAARRLREAFFTQHIPGFDLWACTLTTHAIFTPVQWRAIMMRFRQGVRRRSWAGLWRVELQKRKAPHAHVALWLPPGVSLDEVRTLWLSCTGEKNDTAAQQWAVQGKQIPNDEAGWAVYMGLHHGKSKEAQLGWLGKQWGVWNREAFSKRTPRKYSGGHREHFILLRTLAKLQRSELVGKQRRQELETLALIADASVTYRQPKLPPLPRIHRGNLLRCIDGAVVIRIMDAIELGLIGQGAGA